MPILECGTCGFTFVYTGKSLGLRCPRECGPHYDPTRLHVDRDGIRLNGHGIDASITGRARNDSAARAAEQTMARWTSG